MPMIGSTGFLLLVLVALLLFGPKKLPELGRAFGRTVREFRDGSKHLLEDEGQDAKTVKPVRSGGGPLPDGDLSSEK